MSFRLSGIATSASTGATMYGHASAESRDRAMDVLETFAGNEKLGLGLDSADPNALIYGGDRRGVVPEVGLEPT
jgi:hypothetical protein